MLDSGASLFIAGRVGGLSLMIGISGGVSFRVAWALIPHSSQWEPRIFSAISCNLTPSRSN